MTRAHARLSASRARADILVAAIGGPALSREHVKEGATEATWAINASRTR